MKSRLDWWRRMECRLETACPPYDFCRYIRRQRDEYVTANRRLAWVKDRTIQEGSANSIWIFIHEKVNQVTHLAVHPSGRDGGPEHAKKSGRCMGTRSLND